MPKVGYSEKERVQIREALIAVGLDLMTKQGIQHTTVEQIYKKVGISRTFFYSFFPNKEELIVEALYLQQPQLIEYARKLMNDPAISWRDKVKTFLHSLCYGEKYGIAVLTMDEQRLIFKRLSRDSYKVFRDKQLSLLHAILNSFEIEADTEQLKLVLNLTLLIVITCRALPENLPLLVSEASDGNAEFQMEALVDYLEKLKCKPIL
ncbi:TetR/AcrR family transcriptional regulator [Enterocloster bolteae]|uniref:TetR/AcrR family transcriptional regulator n=1 Tax=Enterocloster bolteae TaxID=208479 RepID=UPI003AB1632B